MKHEKTLKHPPLGALPFIVEELSKKDLFCPFQEENVETPYGKLHCTMTGTVRSNHPVILTFHDVGLNCESDPQQPV